MVAVYPVQRRVKEDRLLAAARMSARLAAFCKGVPLCVLGKKVYLCQPFGGSR